MASGMEALLATPAARAKLTAPNADVLLTSPAAWANGATGTNITWDITSPPPDKAAELWRLLKKNKDGMMNAIVQSMDDGKVLMQAF